MLRNIFRVFSLQLVVSFLFKQLTYSQVPVFIFTETPLVIDGLIDAGWSNYQAEVISNNNNGVVSSEADLNASFKVSWDNTYLYILLEVNDNIVHSDESADMWRDDCLEVYF